MKMLSVLVPCYFCFTSKLKKLLYIFFVFPALVLNIWNWVGVFSLKKKKKKKVWVLHSVWVKFRFSWLFPRLSVLNTVLHKKSSWQIIKFLPNSELAGYHCPAAKPAAMANKHPNDAQENFSSLMAWCISCSRVTMSHSSNGSSH